MTQTHNDSACYDNHKLRKSCIGSSGRQSLSKRWPPWYHSTAAVMMFIMLVVVHGCSLPLRFSLRRARRAICMPVHTLNESLVAQIRQLRRKTILCLSKRIANIACKVGARQGCAQRLRHVLARYPHGSRDRTLAVVHGDLHMIA